MNGRDFGAFVYLNVWGYAKVGSDTTGGAFYLHHYAVLI